MQELIATNDSKVVDHFNCTIWHILGETDRQLDILASVERWKMHYTEFTERVPILSSGRAVRYTVTCPQCNAALQLRVLSAATAISRSYLSIAYLILPFIVPTIAFAILATRSYEHWGIGTIFLIVGIPLIGTVFLHFFLGFFGLFPQEAIEGHLISINDRGHILRTYSRSDGRYPYDALSLENRRRTTLYAAALGMLLVGVLTFTTVANHQNSTMLHDELRAAFKSIPLPPPTSCSEYASFHSMSITCKYPSSVTRAMLEEPLTKAGWTSDKYFFRKDGNRADLLCTSSCNFVIWSR